MRFRLIEIALGTWAMVTAYAILHDQYIAWLSPDHFARYHRAIPGVEHVAVQAAVLAALAAIVPGLALGIALALTAQGGPERGRVGVKATLAGAAGAIGVAEAAGLVAGVAAWGRGGPLYGQGVFFVPGMPLQLVVAQTIQITCYGAGAAAGALLLAGIVAVRIHRSRSPG